MKEKTLYQDKYRIKSTRLPSWDYSSSGFYFITICVKNHYHYFGKIVDSKMALSKLGNIAEQYWKEIPSYFPGTALDEYVIMPNHLHGILILDDLYISTSRIVREYKGKVTHEIRKLNPKFSWQARFYDHVIRNDKDLYRIQEYIRFNPENWALDEENI